MKYSEKSVFKGLKVLVTSGPTSVAIDRMRVITNRSTGEMGRLIANACAGQGSRVTLLEGAVTTAITLNDVTVRKFFEFDELAQALKAELVKGYDVVIHAAAVSDFKLARPFQGKISSGRSLTIKLRPTKKLVNEIKRISPESVLVAFKLESAFQGIATKAHRLFKESRADVLVANCFDQAGYKAFIMRPNRTMTPTVASKKGLVKVLLREIEKIIKEKHGI